MSQTKQAAPDAAPSRPELSRPTPEIIDARNRGIGREIGTGFRNALVGGLGIGGLYYLSQYLGDKYRKATEMPDPDELANTPISEVTAPAEEEQSLLANLPAVQMPTIKIPDLSGMSPFGSTPEKKPAKRQKAAEFDPMFVYAPALGAGAGALLGAVQSSKARRRQNMILGATLGGLGGLGTAAATSKPFHEYVGKNLPKDLIPEFIRGKPSDIPSETAGQSAWRNVLNATLPAAGAAGGIAFTDAMARQRENEQNLRDIEDARREYFKSLTGQDPPKPKKNEAGEKQSSVDEQLDQLYDLYLTKKAADPPAPDPAGTRGIPTIGNWWNDITRSKPGRSIPGWMYDFFVAPSANAAGDAQKGLYGMMLAGGLGAGAVGAKYMYDRTKALSAARNMQRAQDARRRMQGLDSPWVDPTELADLKAVADSGGGASARGV